MSIFQEPPSARYELRFSVAGIPVRVHPLFWLIAVLLGFTADLLQLLIWVVVVFVSILIHELGHALAFRRYGQRSRIILHFAGGLTVPEPVPWAGGWANVGMRPGQDVLVSLAGPGAGFLFAALVIAAVNVMGGSVVTTWLLGFIPLPVMAVLPFGGRVIGLAATMLLWVNVFWGLINLLPIQPLDGGHVARHVLVRTDPIDGMRKALWVSVIAGGLAALVGLVVLRSIYMGLLFALLALQSYQLVQGRSRL